MRAKCSRCTKFGEIQFFKEHINKTTGLRQLRLCPQCTRWALEALIGFADSNYEMVFNMANDTAQIIRDQQEKKRLAKHAGVPQENKPF